MSKDFTGPKGDPAEGSRESIDRGLAEKAREKQRDNKRSEGVEGEDEEIGEAPSDVPEPKSNTGA